jgi:gluconolactonase
MANGNTWDREGRLLTCEHATSRVTRTQHDGTMEVLASHYNGKELNSPNDIVVHSSGAIYFTDPLSGRTATYGVERPQQLPFQGVYRFDPTTGTLTLLADDFVLPNGLCFGLDERQLFVNDTRRGHIRVFDVLANGTLRGGSVWATPGSTGEGAPDGMKIDQWGNLYCTGPGGIHVFDGEAVYLGMIRMPERVANFAWGDADGRTLYITASTSVYAIRTNVAGHRTSA